jgi:ADP-heptose:LPS heptosyltransferase
LISNLGNYFAEKIRLTLPIWLILCGSLIGHLTFSIASLFFFKHGTSLSLKMGKRRCLRWKSLFLHGLESFQWSWWWNVAGQSNWMAIRYIALLEFADLFSRHHRGPSTHHVLVLQLAHVGDFLVSLPALGALHRVHGSNMLLVVSPWSRELALKALPGCRIEVHETAWGSVNRSRKRVGMIQEFQTIRRICRDQPAQLIDFGPPWPVDLLFFVMAKADHYVGQSKPYWHQFDSLGHFSEIKLGADALSTMGEILGHSGLEQPDPWTRSTGCEVYLESLTSESDWFSENVSFLRYTCLGVGAGWDGKRWPIERFKQLAGELVRQYDLPVVFLGSAGERDLAAQAAADLAPNDYVNLCGNTSLTQAIAIVKQADLVICNDSALLHMAGLTDTPSVGLFMPGNAAYWNPKGAQHIALEASGECPCRRYAVGACRNPVDPCMKRIEYSAVSDAVRRVVVN